VLHFFGLTDNYRPLLWDEIFYLIYYMGFSFQDANSLPIRQRKWFIERFVKEIKQSQENNSPPPTKAMHTQTPETRMFSNNSTHRNISPNRLNRPI
jgi:hypothetical protein